MGYQLHTTNRATWLLSATACVHKVPFRRLVATAALLLPATSAAGFVCCTARLPRTLACLHRHSLAYAMSSEAPKPEKPSLPETYKVHHARACARARSPTPSVDVGRVIDGFIDSSNQGGFDDNLFCQSRTFHLCVPVSMSMSSPPPSITGS